MFKNLRKKKKGFTLIELIIVIAIIGVLAAVAIPKFGNASKNAKDNTELANAKTIVNAITMAIAEGDSKFSADISNATDVTENYVGKYLQSIPKTSDGKNFKMKVVGEKVTIYDNTGAKQIYPKEESSSSLPDDNNEDDGEDKE